MHLRSPRLPQQGHDLPGGGAPDNGIVHQHHPFPLHAASQRPQLDAHRLLPAALARGDEGAADIAVFHQPHPIGDAGLLRIAQGGVQPGVGHTDHHIGLRRVLLGQEAPRPKPGLMDALAADGGVRPGKVDVFKNAQVSAARRWRLDSAHLPVLHRHDLAGAQLPLEPGPHRVQGAALGGEHHDLSPAAHAQGPEAPRVPGGHQLPGRHDDEGPGSPQPRQRPAHRLLHRGAAQPGLGDGVGDELGVAGGLENGPLVLESCAQLVRMGQIAVVGQGQGSLDIPQRQRLGVLPAGPARGGIAHMAHRHGPVQPVQDRLVKHLPHQSRVLVIGHLPVIDGGDAAGLLPPVLEGVQTIIGGAGAVSGWVIDAEHAALLMKLHGNTPLSQHSLIKFIFGGNHKCFYPQNEI